MIFLVFFFFSLSLKHLFRTLSETKSHYYELQKVPLHPSVTAFICVHDQVPACAGNDRDAFAADCLIHVTQLGGSPVVLKQNPSNHIPQMGM